MLAIRLQRVGRKKQPIYRVVVSEKTKDMYGNHLEILGSYNPHTKEAVLKEDRIKHWMSNGAQASSSVNNLFINQGLVEGKKTKAVRITKTRAAKQAAAKQEKEEAAKAAQAPKEEVSEEPKNDAPAEEATEEKKEESPVENKEAEDSK